ncbi:MAG: FadR/GntR family transcriptional regulator [Planctomycetota bacterium]
MDKELLHNKAVREVISLIASGQYKEGKSLPSERKLCEQFDISRGTLRKALADLEKMGAIKIRPQSGAYVQKFSHNKLPSKVLPVDFNGVSLSDIIVARRAIELAAMEIASKRITKKELAGLERIVGKMEASLDKLPEFLKYDMRFHESIVKACRNSVLITAFDSISEYHKYSQVYSSYYDNCEQEALKYHKKILGFLQNGKAKSAIRALGEHFDNMKASI